jgi:release factor glutamine methyltransferase
MADPTSAPPPPPPPAPPAGLVARLRAAGCVFAEEEAALLIDEATSPTHLEEMVVRRVAGDPLEQILGWAGFGGLRIRLLPGVFVPRQRSLLLVHAAVEHLTRGVLGSLRGGGSEGGSSVGSTPLGPADGDRGSDAAPGLDPTGWTQRVTPSEPPPRSDPRTSPRVLDLGCGSGALGAAVGARVPDAEVWAVDVDPAAVACARLNLEPARVLLGDLLDPLPGGLAFEVVLANMPYVPTGEIGLMPPEARLHEHRVALDGGTDGLAMQRRAITAAAPRLRPGGVLLVESGESQAERTAELMRAAALDATVLTDAEAGATVVAGVGPA